MVEDYAYTPFLPDNSLGIFYLKDQLDMYSFLTKDEIPQGMSMEELHRLACDNLEQMAKVKFISLVDFEATGLYETDEASKKAFAEKHRLFSYSFQTNIEDHGCLLVLDSYREKLVELCKGNFYAMMPYNSTGIVAENCETSLFKNALESYANCYEQSDFSVTKHILKYDAVKKCFEVCGNIDEDVPCPICSTPRRFYEEYPNAICGKCYSKTTDDDGKPVSFGNVGMHGGIKALYEDGSTYQSHYCYVDNVMCMATEVRTGGIAIEKM